MCYISFGYWNIIYNLWWPTTVTATANYSQQQIDCNDNKKLLTATNYSQQQIDCNDNKNLTSTSNSPQHKQDAHSINENSHRTNENSHSTNENAHSTNRSRRFIVPLSRFEERGNHLAVAGEDLCRSSFLTSWRGYAWKMFGIRGRVKIEWILDAFKKVFIWKFNPSFYLHHDNQITCWEIQQSHTTYVSLVLQQITIGGGGDGGEDYLPTTEKKNSHKDDNKN